MFVSRIAAAEAALLRRAAVDFRRNLISLHFALGILSVLVMPASWFNGYATKQMNGDVKCGTFEMSRSDEVAWFSARQNVLVEKVISYSTGTILAYLHKNPKQARRDIKKFVVVVAASAIVLTSSHRERYIFGHP